MFHMIIRKGRDEVVAMIILGLQSQRNVLLLITTLLDRRDKVLRQQLALLVELVIGSL
jgi:hypothetical protein